MIQEWLTLVLGLVVMVVAVVLVTLAVQFHSQSAFAGAALYSLITLGENLAGIVIHYTRLETSIGAIARLKTFNETVKPEDKEEEQVVPPEQWPQAGVIEIRGVSAAYKYEKLCAVSIVNRTDEKTVPMTRKMASPVLHFAMFTS